MLGPPRVEVLAAVKLFEVEEEKESQPASASQGHREQGEKKSLNGASFGTGTTRATENDL